MNREAKKLKANFIVVFICTLLIATALPAVGNEIFYTAEVPSPLGVRAWSDDFDSYATGSALHGQGGWEGWDNDPQLGAYVVDDPFLSEPHSVDIAGNSDLVHEFSGYASGEWIFTAWAYVPGDLVGLSYFILLSDYADVDPGTNSKWAVQMWFDPVLGIVTVDDGDQLALITDQWVEIRVEIDLETDWHQVFYDGLMLYEKAWTAGPFNAGDGILNIGAVDLFANSATTTTYLLKNHHHFPVLPMAPMKVLWTKKFNLMDLHPVDKHPMNTSGISVIVPPQQKKILHIFIQNPVSLL